MRLYLCGALALVPMMCAAQSNPLEPLPAFPMPASQPSIAQAVRTGEPFTVAGPHGVLVGQQQGEIEAWLLPVKLLSHLSIEADVDGYPVPLDLNSMARVIEVHPELTTITYSHIAITVRQTMFAPEQTPAGTGAMMLFQVDSLRPATIIVRFHPEMLRMWPAGGSGTPSPEWVRQGASGYYVLHTDDPAFSGAVSLPGAVSGIMAPYQERPQEHPLELRLRVDPATDRSRVYPLLMAVGLDAQHATSAALGQTLANLNASLPSLYAQHAELYRAREQAETSLDTPDVSVNRAFAWAETSIEQLQVQRADGERALVAGYYASGDSARPGFGWFFGRDALYTLYAVNSFGDFGLSRDELLFLIRRQRADGKIMHEFSQTAEEVNWAALPYEYAAADATPLFLMAMDDYLSTSGDVAFLQQHKDAIAQAWKFETTHDSDGDGIYDNAQGTGWVESWPSAMPRQEIYLALLDEQASLAMARLAGATGQANVADVATERAKRIRQTIEREYFQPAAGRYAFSWNNGTPDRTDTIYPTIAWWTPGAALAQPSATLDAWASSRFHTDWGTRDIANDDPVYDGMSYHQGSVWPLFTGWTALAQYRAGRPLAAYQSVMQNVDLTWAQDPGAVTELLSGDFYEPFGRSTSHQLWSSAMVITPLLRGMFGITTDAAARTISVTPHLPADWNTASVRSLHVADAVVDLRYARDRGAMRVCLSQRSGGRVALAGADASGCTRSPLPAVEVALTHGLPQRGSRTAQMKLVEETYRGDSLHLRLQAIAGSTARLPVIRNRQGIRLQVHGVEQDGNNLVVTFRGSKQGEYVSRDVDLSW